MNPFKFQVDSPANTIEFTFGTTTRSFTPKEFASFSAERCATLAVSMKERNDSESPTTITQELSFVQLLELALELSKMADEIHAAAREALSDSFDPDVNQLYQALHAQIQN